MKDRHKGEGHVKMKQMLEGNHEWQRLPAGLRGWERGMKETLP